MGSVATVYLLLAYLWAPFRHGRALREAAPLIGRWVRRRSLPRPSYHQCECPADRWGLADGQPLGNAALKPMARCRGHSSARARPTPDADGSARAPTRRHAFPPTDQPSR